MSTFDIVVITSRANALNDKCSNMLDLWKLADRSCFHHLCGERVKMDNQTLKRHLVSSRHSSPHTRALIIIGILFSGNHSSRARFNFVRREAHEIERLSLPSRLCLVITICSTVWADIVTGCRCHGHRESLWNQGRSAKPCQTRVGSNSVRSSLPSNFPPLPHLISMAELCSASAHSSHEQHNEHQWQR
jgi:hypothetical protein